MRIIAGRFRGRPLVRPPAIITRPTMDKVRGSIFNKLVHRYECIEGAKVLDAFAGSGALGLEALSRGARHCTFFEKNSRVIGTIKENIWSLGIQEEVTLLCADAGQPPKAQSAVDLVLLDPPFGTNYVPRCLKPLQEAGWINGQTLIVAEVASREPLEIPSEFLVLEDLTFGTARVLWLQYSG